MGALGTPCLSGTSRSPHFTVLLEQLTAATNASQTVLLKRKGRALDVLAEVKRVPGIRAIQIAVNLGIPSRSIGGYLYKYVRDECVVRDEHCGYTITDFGSRRI